MLLQMPQNTENDDLVISTDELVKTAINVFSIILASKSKDELQLAALKCLNNFFFSNKTVQDEFVKHDETKTFQLLLENYSLISEDNLSIYFMICLVLCSKASFYEAMVPLTQMCIERLCALANEFFVPGKKLNDQILSTNNNVHQTIEAGLKLIYGMAATHEHIVDKLEENFPGSLTEEKIPEILANLVVMDTSIPLLDRLGFVIVRIILAESDENQEKAILCVESLRHQSYCVLMFATKLKTKEQFFEILLQKGVVKKTVQLLDDLYKNAPCALPGKMSSGEEIRARVKRNERMLPILIVLNNLCEHHEGAKVEIDGLFFPYKLSEDDYSNMTEEEATIAKRNRHMKGSTPENSIGGRVIRLMTEIDQNIKRLSGELIWSLCDGDQATFVDRAGYGNGVHLLAIKGGMLGQMMAKGNKLN